MKRVQNGELHPKMNASFVAFVAPITLSHNYRELAGKEIYVTMMQGRWSNDLGFPGGKVEAGETIMMAAIREAKEEVNVDLIEESLEFLCSHSNDNKMHTHLFVYHTDIDTIKTIMKESVDSEHFVDELGGTLLVYLEDFGRGKGIENLLTASLASTVREELGVLCNDLNPDLSELVLEYLEPEDLFINSECD